MKLYKWIEDAGVELQELATFLKVNRTHLFLIRRGMKNPSQRLLGKIKKLTGNKVNTVEDLLDTVHIGTERSRNKKGIKLGLGESK